MRIAVPLSANTNSYSEQKNVQIKQLEHPTGFEQLHHLGGHSCWMPHLLPLLQWAMKGGDAFTSNGFDNWKKAFEKFTQHGLSDLHKEAVLKLEVINQEGISTMLKWMIRNYASKCFWSRFPLTQAGSCQRFSPLILIALFGLSALCMLLLALERHTGSLLLLMKQPT